MNDDQIQNTIDAIRSRIYSATSQAELAKLSLAAAGLLSLTTSSEMEGKISGLQNDVQERTEAVEKALFSEIVSSNEKGHYADDKDKTKELDDLAVENDKIYAKFLLTSEEDLANNKKDNDKLEEVLKTMQAGKELSEDQKKDVVKTPEEIQAELKKNQQREAAEEKAKEEVEIRSAEIEKLKRERDKLPPGHDQRREIEAQIDQAEGRRTEALSIIGTSRKHDREYLRKAKNVHKMSKAAKESGVNQEVADNAAQQLVERVTDAQTERAVKQARLDGDEELAEWFQSAQVQKNVMENPEVAKAAAALANAVKNALEGQQNSTTPPLETSGPRIPNNTPGAKGPTPNKGQGRE